MAELSEAQVKLLKAAHAMMELADKPPAGRDPHVHWIACMTAATERIQLVNIMGDINRHLAKRDERRS